MAGPRVWAAAAVAALGIAVVAWLPPVHQDPAYHRFADSRTVLGIPNFWNVVSNLPFAVVGIAGLRFARRRMGAGWERTAVTVMFAAVAATAAGSAWYHLAPGDGTLFWDRLPMTLAFTALFALVIGERGALWPLVATGVTSVIWWQASGDLRLYGLVQYVPMGAIPLVVLMWPDSYAPVGKLLAGLGCYGLAKIFELLDTRIFAAGGVVSGHTLKHLAAAIACACLLRYFAARLAGYRFPANARSSFANRARPVRFDPRAASARKRVSVSYSASATVVNSSIR